MFSSMYSMTMKNGSRLLFAIAVLLFLVGSVQGIRLVGNVSMHPFGPNNEPRWEWLQLFDVVLYGLSSALAPLIGALVIDRADRWLDQRK